MADSLPFNAMLVNEEYDRVYKAEDWAWYFATFIANGVFPKPSDGLQVIAYIGMEIKVNAGYAFINGYAFRNPVSRDMMLDRAEGAQNRIDRVVVRWDLVLRDVYIDVLKGVPSAKPAAAALTRNTEIWELALADIYVGKGVTKIQAKDITDQRFNSAVCGIVKGTIEEIDASVLTKQFDDFFNTYSQKIVSGYNVYVRDMEEYIAGLEEAGNGKLDDITVQFAVLSSLGRQKYEDFNTNITEYISNLHNKGDTDLAEITQQLLDFRNVNEAEFIKWFEHIKDIFATDPSGEQQIQIDLLLSRMEDVEEMLFTGNAVARLETEDGDYLTDDEGNMLLADWSVCQCQC